MVYLEADNLRQVSASLSAKCAPSQGEMLKERLFGEAKQVIRTAVRAADVFKAEDGTGGVASGTPGPAARAGRLVEERVKWFESR